MNALDLSLRRRGAHSVVVRPYGDFGLIRFRTGPGEPKPNVTDDSAGFRGLLACATLRDIDAVIDGRSMTVLRGDIVLLDMVTLSTLTTAAPETWIGLAMERQSLVDRLAGPPPLSPLIVSRSSLSLAYMRASLLCLWRYGNRDAAHGVGEAQVDLLVGSIEQGAVRGLDNSDSKIPRLLAIARLIREGVQDPAFDAQRLGSLAGLSDGQLSKLVAPLTPTDLIRRSRLAIAHRTLRRGATAHLPVAEVSSRVGMTNLAYFSTSYTTAYGAAPSTLRRQG